MKMDCGNESEQQESGNGKPKNSSRIIYFSDQSETKDKSPQPHNIDKDIRIDEMKDGLLQRENTEVTRKDVTADNAANQKNNENFEREDVQEKIKDEKTQEMIKVDHITSDMDPEKPLVKDTPPLQIHAGKTERLREKVKTMSFNYNLSGNAAQTDMCADLTAWEEETKQHVEV